MTVSGTLFWMMYLILAVVTFLNLLIALLSNVYSSVQDRAEAEHRSDIINYFNKWNRDEYYGFLIYLPPPLNLVHLVFAPLLFTSKDPTP